MLVTRILSKDSNARKAIIYIDDTPLFDVEKEHLIDLDLYVGRELAEEELKEIRTKEEVFVWYAKCINLIARRPRSTKEIIQYLRKNKVFDDVIDIIRTRLQEKGYCNDKEFALWWLRRSKEYYPKGMSALVFELQRKGIAKDIIQEVMEEAPVDELSIALQLAQKRLRVVTGKTIVDKKKKVSDYLVRRGFNWTTVNQVLKEIFNT